MEKTANLAFFWVLLHMGCYCNEGGSDSGLTNSGAPEIVEHPLDIVVSKGEPVTLNCKATGNPTPQIIWYKDGELLSTAAEESSSHRVLLPSGSLFFLRVYQGKNPKPDSGIYWCLARNTHGSAQSKNATLKIATLREDFRSKPKNVQAVLGQQATLECSPPKGYPEPVVSWKKDDRDLRLDHDTRRTVHPSGDLIITDVQISDAGFYKCIARNLANSRETEPAKLTVYEKPKFERTPQDITVEVGGDVDFVCKIGGDPPPVITWRKKDDRMPPVRAQVTGSDLHIDRVIPSDEGEFVCNGRNPAGSVEASARLTVHSPPSFKLKPADQVAEEGSQVTLKCEAMGNPTPAKFWSKEGLQDLMFPGHYSSDNRLEVTLDGSLKINNIQMSDEGQYVCSALNAAGSNSAKANLKVTGGTLLQHPPPIIIRGPANQTLPLASLAILPCSANGRQAPAITWLKNDTDLPPDSRYSVSTTGALHIHDLKKNDTGSFTCRALNDDGEDRWAAMLLVEDHTTPNVVFQRMPEPSTFPGPPGRPKPQNVTDTNVALDWDPPQRPGASPVFAYRVHYFAPHSGARWLPLDPATARGRRTVARELRPSSAYIFVVRAENQHGVGEPSPLSVVVRTKSRAPMPFDANSDLAVARKKLTNEAVVKLIEIQTLNSTAVNLTWKVLRIDAPLQGFYVRWQGQQREDVALNFINVTSKDASTLTISGLKPFTGYKFFVRPYYRSVEGMPSNILDVITQEAAPTAPPSDIQVRMMNLTTLRISWRPPPVDGINGVLKGYQIWVFGNETRFNRNVTTYERAASVTFFHLVPGMTYQVHVAAYTAVGVGKFDDKQRVTMNAATLAKHLVMDRLEKGGTSKFLEVVKSTWFIIVLASIVWLLIALVIFTIYWYRCRCSWGKNGKNGRRHDLPFIKINDSSVASAAGATAHEALWMDHQFYGGAGLVGGRRLQNGSAICGSRDNLAVGVGVDPTSATSCRPEGGCASGECDFYCDGRTRQCANCQPYYHSVGSEYHQVNPPSPTPYATTTLVMNAHRQRMLAQNFPAKSSFIQQQSNYSPNYNYHRQAACDFNNGAPSFSHQQHHPTFFNACSTNNLSSATSNYHNHSANYNNHSNSNNFAGNISNNDKKSRQPILLDFIPPPPAQPPPPVDPAHRQHHQQRKHDQQDNYEIDNRLNHHYEEERGGLLHSSPTGCGHHINGKRDDVIVSGKNDVIAGRRGGGSVTNVKNSDRPMRYTKNGNVTSSDCRDPQAVDDVTSDEEIVGAKGEGSAVNAWNNGDAGSRKRTNIASRHRGALDNRRMVGVGKLPNGRCSGPSSPDVLLERRRDDLYNPHFGNTPTPPDCASRATVDDPGSPNPLRSPYHVSGDSAQQPDSKRSSVMASLATSDNDDVDNDDVEDDDVIFNRSADFSRSKPPMLAGATSAIYRTYLPSMGVSASSMLNSQYGLKIPSSSRISSLPRPVNQAQKRAAAVATGPRDLV